MIPVYNFLHSAGNFRQSETSNFRIGISTNVPFK